MPWMEIIRLVIAALAGALAMWVGIVRIPWTLRNKDKDQP